MKKKVWEADTFEVALGYYANAWPKHGEIGDKANLATAVFMRERDAKRALKRLAKDFGLDLEWM